MVESITTGAYTHCLCLNVLIAGLSEIAGFALMMVQATTADITVKEQHGNTGRAVFIVSVVDLE
jgi:hypothetical protein